MDEGELSDNIVSVDEGELSECRKVKNEESQLLQQQQHSERTKRKAGENTMMERLDGDEGIE